MFGTTIENAARTAVAAAENAAHTAVAAENAVCTAAVTAESAACTAVAVVAETNVTNVFVSAVIGKIRKQSKTFFEFLTVLLYFLFSILVK